MSVSKKYNISSSFRLNSESSHYAKYKMYSYYIPLTLCLLEKEIISEKMRIMQSEEMDSNYAYRKHQEDAIE